MNEISNTTKPKIAYSECYAQVFSHLFLGDCLIESDKIESGSVDLILTDLPYGNMKNAPSTWDKEKTEWDITIEPKKVYEIANRILRKNGKMVLFSQEPYTTKLINEAIPNVPFSYRAIWEKDNFANALGVKVNMVSYFEDILIFSKDYEKGENKIPTNPIYEYLKKCKLESGISTTEFNFMYCEYSGKSQNKHRSLVARYWETSQFLVPTKEIYENVLQPTGFFKMPYEEMIKMNTYKGSIFNLWEGKKYKSNILEYKKDYEGLHPTQKPILLLEDLIKTFSNEGNLVVDLTMGSGSTGVACKNTNRSFIGIEKDEQYFKIAEQRINARTLF